MSVKILVLLVFPDSQPPFNEHASGRRGAIGLPAIRDADRDSNPLTQADPTWSTLVPTPRYLSYLRNDACIGAASARALERVFGRNDIPITVTWTGRGGAADIMRAFTGFREVADQEARNRIYGGLHFDFEHQGQLPRVHAASSPAASRLRRR